MTGDGGLREALELLDEAENGALSPGYGTWHNDWASRVTALKARAAAAPPVGDGERAVVEALREALESFVAHVDSIGQPHADTDLGIVMTKARAALAALDAQEGRPE